MSITLPLIKNAQPYLTAGVGLSTRSTFLSALFLVTSIGGDEQTQHVVPLAADTDPTLISDTSAPNSLYEQLDRAFYSSIAPFVFSSQQFVEIYIFTIDDLTTTLLGLGTLYYHPTSTPQYQAAPRYTTTRLP